MEGARGRRAFLGIGREAPPPSGPQDPDFKAAMVAQSSSSLFRLRVNMWSRLTRRGKFNWEEFDRRLESSEFRTYASTIEAAQSLGWSGLGPAGNWVFGVCGYKLALYGKSAMRHELFHAAQDTAFHLFSQEPDLFRSLRAEYSAHLWGGPLIGVPLVYGGSLFVALGVALIAGTVLGAF
jgi:hypothetical protein